MSAIDLMVRRYHDALRRPFGSAMALSSYNSTIVPVEFDHGMPACYSDRKQGDEVQEAPRPVPFKGYFCASTAELKAMSKEICRGYSRAVSVQAPPGVGKTTEMPFVIQAEFSGRKRVVVLQPTVQLARAHVHDLLLKGKPVQYAGPGSDVSAIEFADGVVAYTTPSDFLMRMCTNAMDDVQFVVIHDECHENDGATHALRSLWTTFKEIHKYIITSATLNDCAEAAQRHNNARPLDIVKCRFKDELDACGLDVLPDGTSAPWTARALYGKKTLMFVERDRIAAYIVALYSNFMKTVSLRRCDNHEAYLGAVKALEEAGPEGVLLVVDSSYQTGYTFDIDSVVDFGLIRQTVDQGNNQLVDKLRFVTAVESRQRAERAGRRSSGVAYQPLHDGLGAASLLAQGEVGVAAAWMYMLGYNPPKSLGSPEIFEKLSVADIPAFLASAEPWSYWERQHIKLREFSVSRSGERPEYSSDDLYDTFTNWARGIQVTIAKVGLKSGDFYMLPSGDVMAEPQLLDVITEQSGDVFQWLRLRLKGSAYKGLADNSDIELAVLWTVWVTAWNTNVSKLVAIDRWRTTTVPDRALRENWLIIPENRRHMEDLLQMASDIKLKWDILREWYAQLFKVYPMQLTQCKCVEVLVEAQLRVLSATISVELETPAVVPKKVEFPLRTMEMLVLSGDMGIHRDRVKQSVICGISADNKAIKQYGKREGRGPYDKGKEVDARSTSSSGSLNMRAKTYVFSKEPGVPGKWM